MFSVYLESVTDFTNSTTCCGTVHCRSSHFI